ncbi:hypothetical protein AsAng_0015000 [Aureispira anguillae]|uniref:Uncharacterized protein n=1 Tax=Aureispira anguillae TaxID=2864201 RepID=A0A916DQL7_9BACT|nr:hypothetical protein AsAng_0015000 [Aureispira anguillae]
MRAFLLKGYSSKNHLPYSNPSQNGQKNKYIAAERLKSIF